MRNIGTHPQESNDVRYGLRHSGRHLRSNIANENCRKYAKFFSRPGFGSYTDCEWWNTGSRRAAARRFNAGFSQSKLAKKANKVSGQTHSFALFA
jgi:hypothetical protein